MSFWESHTVLLGLLLSFIYSQKKLNLSGLVYKKYQITGLNSVMSLKAVGIKNEFWILERSYSYELMHTYIEI